MADVHGTGVRGSDCPGPVPGARIGDHRSNVMARQKTIMVDLDGVLCTEEVFLERPLAEPIEGAKAALKRLRAAGHVVVIYTARGWGEKRVAERWLADHGFEYDGLHMGKPVADVWIDDRAIRFTDWPAVLARLGLQDKPSARPRKSKTSG